MEQDQLNPNGLQEVHQAKVLDYCVAVRKLLEQIVLRDLSPGGFKMNKSFDSFF